MRDQYQMRKQLTQVLQSGRLVYCEWEAFGNTPSASFCRLVSPLAILWKIIGMIVKIDKVYCHNESSKART
jgi:hypothetical protein